MSQQLASPSGSSIHPAVGPARWRRPEGILLGVAAVCALLAGCRDDGRLTDSERPLPFVEAVEALRGPVPEEIVTPGIVRARNQVSVRPEISGRVVEVLVDSGESVRTGQPLVRIDDTAPRERLRQAEADVRLARASETAARARTEESRSRVERIRALAAQSLVSTQGMESAEAELAAAEAGLAEATAGVEQAEATVEERRTELGRTLVRSPVSGRIGERRAEVGMLVDPGSVLLVAGDPSAAIIDVDLAEQAVEKVAVGQPVEVLLRGGPPSIAAELSRISPFLDPSSFTAAAEIELANADLRLRPGTYVEVRIRVGGSDEFTLVPIASLYDEAGAGNRRGVFVVTHPEGSTADAPHQVSLRPVEVVAQGRGRAAVRGLDPGARVVTLGQHLLGGGGSEPVRARVRDVSWEHVLELQGLQDEDLLDGFLAKQRKIAAALGAEIPESEDELQSVLDEGPPGSGSGGTP